MKNFSGMFLFGVCCTMIVGSIFVQSKLNDMRDAAKARSSTTRAPAAFARVEVAEATGVSNAQPQAQPSGIETVAETVIVGVAPAKVKASAEKAQMKWSCKEPRDLSQGSGNVKECGWSY